mmetsp:Transcript_29767/g.74729  ORF Transcript_29767/g.74729 Transcript_29767/m.74729 type:complete len:289 (-) Transcript_29767:276-1142(-)
MCGCNFRSTGSLPVLNSSLCSSLTHPHEWWLRPSLPLCEYPSYLGLVFAAQCGPRDECRGPISVPPVAREGSREVAVSREALELGEVGAALLQVRAPPLVALLALVEQHRRVAAHDLQPRGAVVRRVDGRLGEPQRGGAVARHLAAPHQRLGLQLPQRHHLVHQPHRLRLLRVVEARGEPHLLGALGPHEARHLRAAVARVEAAHLGARLPKHCVVRGDGEVAHHVQDVAAAHGVARHHGHHGLGQPPDLHLEVQHVEARHAVLADVAPAPTDALVAAAAERELPLAR